jgi:hypothetical protein
MLICLGLSGFISGRGNAAVLGSGFQPLAVPAPHALDQCIKVLMYSNLVELQKVSFVSFQPCNLLTLPHRPSKIGFGERNGISSGCQCLRDGWISGHQHKLLLSPQGLKLLSHSPMSVVVF